MPLLDHFHPPLHGPRRWEAFYHSWAVLIAEQLNKTTLSAGFFAEPEIKSGPELDGFEVLVYQNSGGAEVRAAIELVSPLNKDRPECRRTFTSRCAGYLQHGIGVLIIDVVTA